MTLSGAGWTELSVSAASSDLDAIADVLGEYAPGAVWTEPAIETSDHRDFAYTILATGIVRAVVPSWSPEERSALATRLAALALAVPAGPVIERPVNDHDWAEEWKRFYHVLHVGQRLVVRPSWEEYAAAEGEVVVVLDPGAAFGTGQHPSTQLCLAALEREVRTGMRVLDVGCGSGILAVAAAALGAREVIGVDIDAESAAATTTNAVANGFESVVSAGTGSVGTAWPWPGRPAEGFDLVVANISAAVLTRLLVDIAATMSAGAIFVGAGFIEAAAADVRAAARAAGLDELRIETLEDESGVEWQCLVAQRPR